MPAKVILVIGVAALALAACRKSTPPPQEPVKPRGAVQIEVPARLPAP